MKRWAEMTERERDALIASEVMGWTDDCIYRAEYVDWTGRYVRKGVPRNEWQRGQALKPWEYWGPNFSTNIADAWTVVEKLSETFGIHVYVQKGFNCSVDIYYDTMTTTAYPFASGDTIAYAKTAAEAICIAALRAVGCEVVLD